MFKNVASQKIALFAFDTATGTAKTGDAANITAYVSKDFGAVTVLGDTSATEMDATNAKGWYLFDLTQAETNADALLFTGKSVTANISVVGQLIYTTSATAVSSILAVLGTPAVTIASDIGDLSSQLTGIGSSISNLPSAVSSSVWEEQVAPHNAAGSAGCELNELHLLHGLRIASPMTVTPTSRVAGTVSQALSGDGIATKTVTRNP